MRNREKVCEGYCGIACVDGSCPKANTEEYAERRMDVVKKCNECIFYHGCVDCCFFGTEYCVNKSGSIESLALECVNSLEKLEERLDIGGVHEKSQ